jgi:hypothetical protein
MATAFAGFVPRPASRRSARALAAGIAIALASTWGPRVASAAVPQSARDTLIALYAGTNGDACDESRLTEPPRRPDCRGV